jgi:hypothetical protein
MPLRQPKEIQKVLRRLDKSEDRELISNRPVHKGSVLTPGTTALSLAMASFNISKEMIADDLYHLSLLHSNPSRLSQVPNIAIVKKHSTNKH